MLLRMNKALNDRRKGLKREEGFTLIELLVVVIIIGILAAIAIPIYIGVQNSSKDSAVKSDLANAKIAVIAWSTDNPGTTFDTADLTVAALGDYGFTESEFTTAITGVVTGWPDFCLTAPKASDATTSFQVTSADGVTDGDCT